MFFNHLILVTPQLTNIVARTPNIQPPVEAHIELRFSDRDVNILSPPTFTSKFVLSISCRQLDWQLSSLTQVCSSSLLEAFISTAEHLYICGFKRHSQNDIENTQWQEVLRPFTAVKHLYLAGEFAPYIAPALPELAGVLPSLQNLFWEDLHPWAGHFQGAIGKFVAARQLAGHPIAVSHWGKKQDEGLEGDD